MKCLNDLKALNVVNKLMAACIENEWLACFVCSCKLAKSVIVLLFNALFLSKRIRKCMCVCVCVLDLRFFLSM